MKLTNTIFADQFVPVYGPATPFTASPLFHVTHHDACKLRAAGDADFCSRGKALRLRIRAAGRRDIVTFALPTDVIAAVPAEETGSSGGRDHFWHGNSLRPNRWLMDANSWDQFWAKVVTNAWHGFMRGTKGTLTVRVVSRAVFDKLPAYVD